MFGEKKWFIILAALLLFGGTAPAGNADYPGTDEGAKKLVKEFTRPKADCPRLFMSLKPDDADYSSFFQADYASKALEGYQAVWRSDMITCPSDNQSEVLVFKATTEELIGGADSADNFPGGWKEAAAMLQPGLTLYRFKWVQPGEAFGTSYDGLVYLNGHWVLFPKPWKFVK